MKVQNIIKVSLLSTETSYSYPIKPFFFIPLAEKVFETLLKYNRAEFISKSFALKF